MLRILSTLLIAAVVPMTASAETQADKDKYAQYEAARDANGSTPAPAGPAPVAPPEPAALEKAPAPMTAPALSANDVKIAAELQSLESEVSNAMATIADDSARFRMITQMNNLQENYEKVKGNINRKTYREIMGGIGQLRRTLVNLTDNGTAPAMRGGRPERTTAATEQKNKNSRMNEEVAPRTDIQTVTVDVQPTTASPANGEIEKMRAAEQAREKAHLLQGATPSEGVKTEFSTATNTTPTQAEIDKNQTDDKVSVKAPAPAAEVVAKIIRPERRR